MSLLVRLYNSSLVADLSDSTVYGIREGQGSLGWPDMQRVYAEVWGRGFHPPVGQSAGNRPAELSLLVRGTSLDDWIANWRNVDRILRDAERYWDPQHQRGAYGDRAYLDVQLNGMTLVTTWDVLGGDFPASAVFRYLMTVTTAPVYNEAPLSLMLFPFARSQALSQVASGTLTNGGGVAGAAGTYLLAAPSGDVETDLRVAIKMAAGVDYRRAILARRTRGNPNNFVFEWRCEAGSYTDSGLGAATAVAAAQQGNVERYANDVNPFLTFALTNHLADHYGIFRVFLRVDVLSGADAATMTFALTYGGSNGTDITADLGTITPGAAFTDGMVDLGVMYIPHRSGPLNQALTSFSFRIAFVGGGGGVYTLDTDAVYLVPIDEQVLDVELGSNSATQDQLVSDGLQPDPSTYLLNSSGDLQAQTIATNQDDPFTLLPDLTSLWCVLLFESASVSSGPRGHNLADTFTLDFQYHARYALAR